jgi:PST family polysaccharide transporter/teichuronic acid exporter
MSLSKKAVVGTMWTSGSSVISALIQILRLSILTRFLDKSDFGLVAIVVLVLGFTHIFTDLGISVSLFSRKDISKKEYSSLYWVSLLLSVFLYIIIFSSSFLISNFYHLPELNKLIPIMGFDLIITTAGRQFRVFKQKDLQFKSLAVIDIISLLISLVIAL